MWIGLLMTNKIPPKDRERKPAEPEISKFLFREIVL